LEKLTINCYLYNIRKNREMQTREPIIQRFNENNRNKAVRRKAPERIDCSYCITAWSGADDNQAKEEHHLLSQTLEVLLKHSTIPEEVLKGDLVNQIRPYPFGVAGDEGIKNQPEFWGSLEQPLKPSINYIVTLAMMLDDDEIETSDVVKQVVVEPHMKKPEDRSKQTTK
jgi:hypothetical protein